MIRKKAMAQALLTNSRPTLSNSSLTFTDLKKKKKVSNFQLRQAMTPFSFGQQCKRGQGSKSFKCMHVMNNICNKECI